jgi:hypothetical protein
MDKLFGHVIQHPNTQKKEKRARSMCLQGTLKGSDLNSCKGKVYL